MIIYTSTGVFSFQTINGQNMVLWFTSVKDPNVTIIIQTTGWMRNYKFLANTVTTSDAIPKTGTDDTMVKNYKRLWEYKIDS